MLTEAMDVSVKKYPRYRMRLITFSITAFFLCLVFAPWLSSSKLGKQIEFQGNGSKSLPVHVIQADAALSDLIGGPQAKEPQSITQDKPKENFAIKMAVQSFREFAESEEQSRTSVFWSKVVGDREIAAISIKSPDDVNIAAFSDFFSKTLASVAEKDRTAARKEIQAVYDTYTKFAKQYKVLYVRRRLDSKVPDVQLTDVDDLEGAQPSEQGLIRLSGSFTLSGDPNWWKRRFGHLLEVAPEK